MATSYATFCNGLADLSVAGVKRKLRHIPTQIAAADLPLQFVRLPDGAESPLTRDGEGGWPRMTCELVIVVEPLHLNRAVANQGAVLALIDALNEALRAVTPDTLCKSQLSWTVRGEQDFIGDTAYWLLIASVTGNG